MKKKSNNRIHRKSCLMDLSKPETLTSMLSELLLYHAALGRGYNSPFPPTRGLVFTSALPVAAGRAFNIAENSFRRWHAEQFKELHKEFESIKFMPTSRRKSPEIKERYAMLKEELSKHPMVTFNDPEATTDIIYRALMKSYYGSITHIDTDGRRLVQKLLGARTKLPFYLSMAYLTDEVIKNTMLDLKVFRGQTVPLSNRPVFNLLANSQSDLILHCLRDRIMNSDVGVQGIGRCILLQGRRNEFTQASPITLYDLMMKVYVRGKDEPSKRVKVTFDDESSDAWQRFLKWNQTDIFDAKNLTERALKSLQNAPASPELSVRFGSRAALVRAFLNAVGGVGKTGPIDEIILGAKELGWAEKFAKHIYFKSSGLDQVVKKRSKNTQC
jgi:hypothetical protein